MCFAVVIQNALPRPLRLRLPSLGTGPYPCPGCCRGGWEGHSCLLCEPTCYWRPCGRLKGELSAGSARPEAGAGICQLFCIFWEGKKKILRRRRSNAKHPGGCSLALTPTPHPLKELQRPVSAPSTPPPDQMRALLQVRG